jgi:GTP:adenosylcobinamide-phosphate guanylyltransferase
MVYHGVSIFDELKRNEIDIDKQTLSFHINTILDHHRDPEEGGSSSRHALQLINVHNRDFLQC